MSGEAMGLISERERKRKSRNLLLMFVSSCDQISSYLVLLFLFLLVLFTDGIGDEEAPTRQFGPVRVLPSAVSVSCHDGPATAASASEKELPSKTRASREGDHRLIRSDSTRSQA
jgi:Na+-transporting methylmalonyl-CoA/oxaloacetate decarboxylase gamma subunit